MANILTFIHKTLIILICCVLLVALMFGASHLIHRQYSELSDSLQNITHQLIRQTTYSLSPLVHSYNAENDNSEQITTVLEQLIQQPWIIDISIYQLNGALIARAGDDMSVRERLVLDDTPVIDKPTRQLVEKINFSERPVGFIRLTLNPESLQPDTHQIGYMTKLMWLMLAIAGCLGFLIAYTLIGSFKKPLSTTVNS